MALWQIPENIRAEHALQSGAEIPPFYDSMIAKLVSHGATRDEARRQLIAGLEHIVAFGVTTNQAFLAGCLRHPAFAAGEATTAFIERYRSDLVAPSQRGGGYRSRGITALCTTHAPPWRDGRTLAATFPLPFRIGLGEAVHEAEIVRERDGGYVADSRPRAAVRDRGTRP